MRGKRTVLSVFLVQAFFGSASIAQAQSGTPAFMNECFGKTRILPNILKCKVEDGQHQVLLEFILARGRTLQTIGYGNYQRLSKTLPVSRIQRLAPEVSDSGVEDETVRFLGNEGAFFISIRIPCRQEAVALVGVGKVGGGTLPDEVVAECSLYAP